MCPHRGTVGGLSLGRRDLSLPGSALSAPGRNSVQQKQAPTMRGPSSHHWVQTRQRPPLQGHNLQHLCPGMGAGASGLCALL